MKHKYNGYNRKLAEGVYQFDLFTFFEPEEEWII
jgi:hypothetical protein